MRESAESDLFFDLWCVRHYSVTVWYLLPVQDIHSQGEVIACLEKGLVREAEERPGVHPIKDECKKSIMRVAELSSDDFHLDRYLYFACREDRERFCENVSISVF